MRPVVYVVAVVLSAGLAWAQPVLETPHAADVPQPVPAESSLAGASRPDISRFLNVRRAGAPSPSPDGAQVAFGTSVTGTPQLWVVDAGGGWPRQLTFGEPVTFHRWSPAGDWIIYGTDRGGNEREGFYLISPDGTRERELLAPSDAFRRFGGFSRDGRRIAYATTKRDGREFDIHLLDVASGVDREVFRGRMGLYAVSWRPDGAALLLSEARGEDANDLFLLDVETGNVETVFQPDVASRYGSFAWVSDSSGFYLVTDHNRELAGLAYYDIAERALTFIDTPDSDVQGMALSPDDRLLAWSISDGGYSTLHVRDLLTGADVAPPELPPGRHSLTWAPDVNVASISVAGPRVPGDLWTWEPRSDTVVRVTHSSTAGLDMSDMVVPTHHSFPARDGTVIHGLLYRPTQQVGDPPAPVLLSVHGGPTGQATPRFNGPHQYLLTRGIAIFDLNYRGSIGYGKTFARLNDRRLRDNELYDLEDAVEWLGRQDGLDAGRVAIMGGSYGGYLTMAGLSRLPALFASGVAFVGVSNWVTALEGAGPALQASDRIEYGDINDPLDREFFRHISPINYVSNVRAPVMVLHGVNDPRDPVTESDQFVRAIRERGGEVEYLRYPDEGHGIRKLSNRIIAYRRIAAFLERTLGITTGTRAQ